MFMKSLWAKWVAFLFAVSLLAACGGGGGGSTPGGGGSGGGEGSSSGPLSVGTATTSIIRASTIGAGADSYFSFTSGAASVYAISLQTNQSDLEWKLFLSTANFSGIPRTVCDSDVVGNEVCFTTPSLSASTTYHLKVHNYGSITSSYTLVIAPPATPITSFPLTATFESGALPSGWLASGTWAVSSAAAYNGSYSVTDSPGVNYLNSTNMYLISPVMNLSGIANPSLTFYHKYDFENAYDYGVVEVSSDGGATFTEIGSYTSALTGFSQATIDLSLYKATQNVIRFRVNSDISTTRDGWYIDDITIQ